jgi:4-diphosphocytidyl-2-C-methyl-D-erythritol kinase
VSDAHSFPAPAKLNLFLHVTGRRADGYHTLQTLFRFIDLADEIKLTIRPDGVVKRVNELANLTEKQDLCVRAAKMLQQATGVSLGADIHLTKQIPIGGGLGGGSSDAATVLIALNRLWAIDWPRAKLQEWSSRLGADVPVFIFGRSALATGVGEVLTTVTLAPAWYLVLMPQVSVSTAEIFTSRELTRDTNPITMAAFFAGHGRNDLQAVVCDRYPDVARHLEWLRQFGRAAMSGSGACVFCGFDSEHNARAAQAQVPAGMRAVVARGLDRHPLHDTVQ